MKTHEITFLLTGRKYSISQVLQAVDNADWQAFRISLKGRSTEDKVRLLKDWKESHNTEVDDIRVQNYVYALKRGGQIKD